AGVRRVLPMVDIRLRQVEPDGEVASGAVGRRLGRRIPGTGVDVVCGQLAELVRAHRRELDVHHPRCAGRIDARVRARDVVAGEAGEGRFAAGLRTAGHLVVLYPLRVDELRDRADGLLRLLGVDAGKVDGDAVVVRARAPDLRLADVQRVDAPVDDLDRPLLDI